MGEEVTFCHRLLVVLKMFFLELGRRKLSLLFLLAMPMIFFFVMYFTTEEALTPIRLFNGTEDVVWQVSDRLLTALVMGSLGICATASFAALTMIMGGIPTTRRLMLCGYRASQLLLARVLLLAVIMLTSTLIFSGVMLLLIKVNNRGLVFLGLFLVGLVGICLGNLLGLFFNQEFQASVGLLAVLGSEVAMAMRSADVERFFPMHYPLEIIKMGAFTQATNAFPFVLGSLGYSLVLLAVSLTIWSCRTQIHRHGGSSEHVLQSDEKGGKTSWQPFPKG